VVVAVVSDTLATDDSPAPAIGRAGAEGGSSESVFLYIAGGALVAGVILAGVVAAVWLRGRKAQGES
jgi:hypothetical protein